MAKTQNEQRSALEQAGQSSRSNPPISSASSTMTKTSELAADFASGVYTGATSAADIFTAAGPDLAEISLDKLYGSSDINTVPDNSLVTLRTYGNRVAAIALDNAPPAGTEDELTILNRALTRKDPELLRELDPTIAAYENMLAAMLVAPVPSSMAAEHLALTNVYQSLLNDIKAFRSVFTDALPTMLRFRRYPADAEALYLAINDLYLKLHRNGIQWSEADRASKFIAIEKYENN